MKSSKAYDIKGIQTIGAASIDFATTERYRKCDVKPLEGQTTVGAAGRVRHPPRAVTCVGPRGNFALDWTEPSGSPDLKSFALENDKLAQRLHRDLGGHLKAVYSPAIGRLAELLNEPNFTVTRVESIEVEGHACTRVAFSWMGTPRTSTLNQPNGPQEVGAAQRKAKAPRAVGSFVVDPRLGSVLRSWEYSDPEDPTRSESANLRYDELDPAAGAVPLPREIERISNKALHRTLTFERIERRALPDDQFTLNAYGMPEFDRPVGDVTRSTLGYWLTGLAVAFLGLAGWLWRRSRATRVAV